MESLGVSLLSERIREFLHLLHACRFQSELEEVIRIAEKSGWASETELNHMVQTANALCARMGEIRTLSINLIEDSRAIVRRLHCSGGPDPGDMQITGEPSVD